MEKTIPDLESESIVITRYVLSSLRMLNESNDDDDVTATNALALLGTFYHSYPNCVTTGIARSYTILRNNINIRVYGNVTNVFSSEKCGKRNITKTPSIPSLPFVLLFCAVLNMATSASFRALHSFPRYISFLEVGEVGRRKTAINLFQKLP